MKKHTLWFSGEIVDVSPAGRNLFLLTVTAPPSLPEPSPGTFAMIKLGKNRVPLLPRPLSILDYRDGTLIFLFRVVGEGTLLLSLARSGDPVEISAPLGNGFPHPDSLGTGDPMLIAGGVGIPPLWMYHKMWRGTLLLGATSMNALPRIPATWIVATDDGSAGYKGTVVDLARQMVTAQRPSALLSCGPVAMMSLVARLAEENDIPCFVSLESPMACGVGVCHGCAWPLKDGTFAKVCLDGPVFNTAKIVI